MENLITIKSINAVRSLVKGKDYFEYMEVEYGSVFE